MRTSPPTASMERIDTCFARLYRSAGDVYKLREPVALRVGDESVDLTSLGARRAACLEEDALDRRLAPDVALGVVPLTREPDGRERFGGAGEPIDWALHMRRLPDTERADRRLAEGTLSDAHLHAVAKRLAAFHEDACGGAADDAATAIERLRAQIVLRIEPYGGSSKPLPAEVARIEAWQHTFLDAEAERFARRARHHAIREGHGELALDHVFVADAGTVRIVAGLEMGPRFRHADVAADVALLATDIAARHRVDLAERFVAEYARIANDFDLYPLLDFYASLHATQRGKLDWLCAERFSPDPEHARLRRARARRHFALALALPRHPLLPAAVVAMGGQVASGKSTVARHIARRIGAPVVSADATRDFLLGARVDAEIHEMRWEAAYEPGFAVRVYEEVLRRAGEVLASGRPVVIDGCFRSQEQRERARALAARFGRPFLFVEAVIAEDVQRARLAERAERDAVPLSVWQDIADQLRAEWEPADELTGDERLGLDTAHPLDHSVDVIEARLPTWPHGLTG